MCPRGQALGFAQFLPEGDRVSETFTKLKSQLSTLFAGRIVEGLIFGEDKITTGLPLIFIEQPKLHEQWLLPMGLLKRIRPDFLSNEDGMGAIKGVSKSRTIDVEMRKIIDRTNTSEANLKKIWTSYTQ